MKLDMYATKGCCKKWPLFGDPETLPSSQESGIVHIGTTNPQLSIPELFSRIVKVLLLVPRLLSSIIAQAPTFDNHLGDYITKPTPSGSVHYKIVRNFTLIYLVFTVCAGL